MKVASTQADVNRGLFWVKGELGQCLQRVRGQIEAYLESGDDNVSSLEASVRDLRELASIAGVIQCYSIQLLADEMLKTMERLLQTPGDRSEASFGAIVSAALQLGDYVELLAHGEIDHPLVFAPSVNELRVSRGAKLYSRAAMFSRFLELRGLEIEPPANERRRVGMSKALAGKHSPVMQQAVLDAIRGENRERSLKLLAKAANQLASVACDARMYQCWRGVEALCFVLLAESDMGSQPEAQKLLAKVGQCIKALATNGEKAVARAAGTLGAQCLQLMTLSDAEDAQIESVRCEFGLSGPGASEAHLASLRGRLNQPNIESLQTVTREIRHNLHDIKDTIDLALRSGRSPSSSETLVSGLHSLGSTLIVLGLDALGQMAEAQAQQVESLQDDDSDEPWMQVAEALIRIEQGLDAELMPSSPAHIVDKSAHQDLREGVGAVLRESLINLNRIKVEVDHYVKRGQAESLDSARTLMQQIASAFQLLAMDEAVEVLGDVAAHLLPSVLEAGRTRAHVADRLADTIAGVEYFVEAVQEHQPGTQELLQDVRAYVQVLDETLAAVASGEDVPELAQAVEEAPQDIDPEFREIFIEESGEVLQELSEVMPRWTQNPSDEQLLADVRRAFHTLKGSGRMVGAVDIGEFAWCFEDALNRCRDGSLPLDSHISDLVVEAVALLPQLIERLQASQSASELIQPLLSKLRQATGDEEAEAQDELRDEVKVVFLEDASSYLQLISERAAHSESTVSVDDELVRALHSMRGGAAAVGLMAISELAAAGENLTQTLRANAEPVETALLKRLAESFSAQLQSVRQEQEPVADQALQDELQGALEAARHSSSGIDLELAAIFSEEALGLLEDAEKELLNWSNRPDSDEAERTLQRIFHTMKGSARTAGAQGLGHVGEALDALMKSVLAGDVQPIDDALFSRIKQSIMASYDLLDQFREGVDGQPDVALAALSGEAELTAAPAATTELVVEEPELALAIEPEAESEPEPEAEPVSAEVLAEDDFSRIEDDWPPQDEELLEMFLAEGQDLLESIDQHFATWEEHQQAVEPLRALQRDLHTFKGGARMAGLHSLGAVAHEMETTFSRLEAGDSADGSLFGRLHNAIDGLHSWLDGVKAQQPPMGVQNMLEDLRGDAGVSAVGPSSDVATPLVADLAEAKQDDAALELLEASSSVEPEPELELVAAPTSEPEVELEATPEPEPEPALELESQPEPQAAEAVELAPAEEVDPELLEIFLPEGMELMEAFDEARGQLQDSPADALAELLRVLHTLKGGARMAGLQGLGDEVHELESGLEGVSRDGSSVDEALLTQLEQASDRFHAHLSAAKSGGAVPAAETVSSADETPELALREEPETEPRLAAEPVAESVEEIKPPESVPSFSEAPAAQPAGRQWSEDLHWEAPTDERLAAIRRETARVSVEQLDSMLNEAGEISIYRARLERQVNAFSGQLREVEQTIARIRDQLRSLENETDAQIQARTQGMQPGEESDRYGEEFDPLEMDRYSRMQELTRALSESVTDLSSLHATMADVVGQTDTLLLQQGRVNTSVQQGLMSTLMVPFSRQVQRLQRVVRQTANDNAKQVELQMDGIEAEMDRNVLERMTPVIEHVIRNCVIHGLETPAERKAVGKTETGKVSISLSREGSKLAIEVRDDGKGLDFDRIRTKAIDKGMMTADAKLSEAELAQFIFQPGFSTAEALTQDAGRGVGMDVVSAEVKQLGGTLELDSQTGKGARFVIRLPLSLAISQALLVEVGSEVYATPLANIEGIARLPAEELSKFMDDEQSFSYGGHEYRVRYLGQLLGTNSKLSEKGGYVPVILVHTGEGMGISERRVAVAVDQLLGSRELVTKTAGPQVSTVVGVTGATIRADGRVVLILDVVALVQDRLFKTLQHADSQQTSKAQEVQEPMVMVIDDSITMRRVAERLLTRNGYRVSSAKDGMDGIAQLQSNTPDAVLLDIEMPKVDGFEVATFIRNTERLAKLPIIMITSRSGDKHRERAAAIGVNRYLIKPYQEQQLIQELQDVMSEEA